MNEKYVQALILGSIIGLAIVIDDIISPKNLINNAPISIGIIDEKSKNSDQLIKIFGVRGSVLLAQAEHAARLGVAHHHRAGGQRAQVLRSHLHERRR